MNKREFFVTFSYVVVCSITFVSQTSCVMCPANRLVKNKVDTYFTSMVSKCEYGDDSACDQMEKDAKEYSEMCLNCGVCSGKEKYIERANQAKLKNRCEKHSDVEACFKFASKREEELISEGRSTSEALRTFEKCCESGHRACCEKLKRIGENMTLAREADERSKECTLNCVSIVKEYRNAPRICQKKLQECLSACGSHPLLRCEGYDGPL